MINWERKVGKTPLFQLCCERAASGIQIHLQKQWKIFLKRVLLVPTLNYLLQGRSQNPPLYFQSGELTFSSTYMLEESQLQHGKRLLQYSSLQEWSFSIAQPWLCQNSLYAMARFIIPGLLLKEEEGGKPTECPNKTHTANAMKIHVPAEPTSIQRQPFFPIPRSTLHVVFSISNLPAISNSHPPVNCL